MREIFEYNEWQNAIQLQLIQGVQLQKNKFVEKEGAPTAVCLPPTISSKVG